MTEKKLVIDEQLAFGLGEQIVQALAKYFKLDPEQVEVSNDKSSPEHTLIHLSRVKRSSPKVKLRLQELERHQRTEIYFKTEDEVTDIELRIEDAIVVEITEKVLGQ